MKDHACKGSWVNQKFSFNDQTLIFSEQLERYESLGVKLAKRSDFHPNKHNFTIFRYVTGMGTVIMLLIRCD